HWMPDESHRLGSASNRDLVLDSFVVVPRNSEILVSWNVELDSDEERCLGALANEITYLGRAESVCSVRLAVEDAEHSGTWLAPATKAYEDATVSVLVP